MCAAGFRVFCMFRYRCEGRGCAHGWCVRIRICMFILDCVFVCCLLFVRFWRFILQLLTLSVSQRMRGVRFLFSFGWLSVVVQVARRACLEEWFYTAHGIYGNNGLSVSSLGQSYL